MKKTMLVSAAVAALSLIASAGSAQAQAKPKGPAGKVQEVVIEKQITIGSAQKHVF